MCHVYQRQSRTKDHLISKLLASASYFGRDVNNHKSHTGVSRSIVHVHQTVILMRRGHDDTHPLIAPYPSPFVFGMRDQSEKGGRWRVR